MAPEIFLISEDSQVENQTTKCDIWSFGIMLLEIVTNKKPYGDKINLYELLNNKSDKNKIGLLPETLFLINRECDSTFNFISRCLCPNPDKRPDATSLLTCGYFNINKENDNKQVNTGSKSYCYKDVLRVWNDQCDYQPTPEMRDF